MEVVCLDYFGSYVNLMYYIVQSQRSLHIFIVSTSLHFLPFLLKMILLFLIIVQQHVFYRPM